MKMILVALFTLCTFAACQKKEELPQAPKSEAATTEPAGYLSSVTKAQQSMEKKIDTTSLNTAIQLFDAQEGRLPTDLNELVTKKYLGKLPTPPFGSKLQYDAKEGKVSVVKE